MSLLLRKLNFYNGEINYFVEGQGRYLYPMNVAHCQICSVAGWEADLINIASNGLSNITLLDSLHHGIPPLDSLHHGFCNPWDATNNRNPQTDRKISCLGSAAARVQGRYWVPVERYPFARNHRGKLSRRFHVLAENWFAVKQSSPPRHIKETSLIIIFQLCKNFVHPKRNVKDNRTSSESQYSKWTLWNKNWGTKDRPKEV